MGGYIDLQVNGGGGVLFNDDPSLKTIERMVESHGKFGSSTIFPTLITDARHKMLQAARAVIDYIDSGRLGCGGIHFEGPFISHVKAGAHNPSHIRKMGEDDVDFLVSLGIKVIVTLAPECVELRQITRLAHAGVTVSLGHSSATFAEAMAAFDAGASMVTHLYNAMSQILGREPGLVGAALAHQRARCGIIVDGHHVHYSNVRMAYDLKGPGSLFLVTDSMPPVGADMGSFTLLGQEIEVANGRCTTKDGMLAGSMLDMQAAVDNCVRHLCISRDDALRMARPWV